MIKGAKICTSVFDCDMSKGQHCFAGVPCSDKDAKDDVLKDDKTLKNSPFKLTKPPTTGGIGTSVGSIASGDGKKSDKAIETKKEEEEVVEESKSYSSYSTIISVFALIVFAGFLYWRCKGISNSDSVKLYRPVPLKA